MTPEKTTLAISGVTGNIGGAVLQQLASSRGLRRLLALARDAARAPHFDGVQVRVADYANLASCEQALDGVDVFFMVSASETHDRVAQHRNIIAAAVSTGVRHIVYTSFVGAGPETTFTLGRDHGLTEDAIRDSGIEFTFLRNNFYLDILPEFADEHGVIRGPAGDGRVAAVARADVVDVAVAVLRNPEKYCGRTLNLTGSEAVTFAELADRASTALGKPITFVNETLDEAYASRAQFGAPDWQMDAWVSTYTAIASGEMEQVSDSVRMVTGRAPRTLEDVL